MSSLYVFIGHDGPDGAEKRNLHRTGHLAHLDQLDSAGRLAYAGPIRNDSNEASVGAIIIIEANSLEEARQTFAQDPFVQGGVFESSSVSPFRKAYPKS